MIVLRKHNQCTKTTNSVIHVLLTDLVFIMCYAIYFMNCKLHIILQKCLRAFLDFKKSGNTLK